MTAERQDSQPLVGPPIAYNDRGFYDYGGGPIATTYGHTVTVRESSSAEGPHVWILVNAEKALNDTDPHLSLAQAIAVRTALDQFISSVPERWTDGERHLAEARQEALGETS